MKLNIFAIGFFLLSTVLFAQEERKVLVEVFTNTFCSHCPAAHNTLEDYIANSPNSDQINYLYFHMSYPYPGDPFYAHSMQGSDERHNFYNPVQSTPRGIFNGVLQGSISGWVEILDDLVVGVDPLIIELSGTTNTLEASIKAGVTRIGALSDNDLVIHFVAVEDVYYEASNGINEHYHVMRKMFPTPSGSNFSINSGETKTVEQNISFDQIWDADSLSFIVFVQSVGSKTVYGSETISYQNLTVTNVDDDDQIPQKYILEQNFPNPFNPSTTISFSIPVSGFASLKIYNVLGKEVTTLVNGEKSEGKYTLTFDASGLPSGTYFYRLVTGNSSITKKMLLIK